MMVVVIIVFKEWVDNDRDVDEDDSQAMEKGEVKECGGYSVREREGGVAGVQARVWLFSSLDLDYASSLLLIFIVSDNNRNAAPPPPASHQDLPHFKVI